MAGSAYVNTRVRVTAAQMAGESRHMDAYARNVMRSVQRVASQYVDTGAYINAFRVVTVKGLLGTGKLVDDRLIINDDPAALPQEWGYMRVFKNSRRVQYIPGRHIMRRGMQMVPGV